MLPIAGAGVSSVDQDTQVKLTTQIFGFLDAQGLARVARVSRLCKNATDLVISRVAEKFFCDFLSQQPIISDETILQLLGEFPESIHNHIRTLEIEAKGTQKCTISALSLAAIAKVFPNLSTFSLKTTDVCKFENVTDSAIDSFTKSLPKLQNLTLQGLPLSTQGLTSVVNNCEALQSISIYAPALSDSVVQLLVEKHGPHLARLELGGHSNALTRASLYAVGKHCTHLKSFAMRVPTIPFSKKSVKALISALGNLESFSLRGCVEFSDNLVRRLALRNPALRYCNLGNCTRLTAESLQTLGQTCRKLTTLSLSDCADAEALSRTMESLRIDRFKSLQNLHIYQR